MPGTVGLIVHGFEVVSLAPSTSPGAGVYIQVNGIISQPTRQLLALEDAHKLRKLLGQVIATVERAGYPNECPGCHQRFKDSQTIKDDRDGKRRCGTCHRTRYIRLGDPALEGFV